jgi:hypothetical protein
VIKSGKYRTGWLYLLLGLAGVGAGGAGAGWSIYTLSDASKGELNDGEKFGLVTLATVGIGAAVAGMLLGYQGIAAIRSSTPSEMRTIVEPAWTTLKVETPGGSRRSHRLSISPLWLPPRLEDVGRVHFFEPRLGEKVASLSLVTATPGVEVLLQEADAAPRSLGRTPLQVEGRVRRKVPGIGHYGRDGRPMFAGYHGLQLAFLTDPDGQPRWFKGKLKLSLLLRAAEGADKPLKLELDAARAWKRPGIVARLSSGSASVIAPRVEYGRVVTAASAPAPAPALAPAVRSQLPAQTPAPGMVPGYRDSRGNCVCPAPTSCPREGRKGRAR